MVSLFGAVAVYGLIFGLDYLLYKSNKTQYKYVSRRTYGLFLGGQMLMLGLFWSYYRPFFDNFATEAAAVVMLLFFVIFFSSVLSREKLMVCHFYSRTERCLTPHYVLVKGADIVFQQLVYLVIAISLAEMIGVSWVVYVIYTAILAAIHLPVVLSANTETIKLFSFGLFTISAPIFYVYNELGLFWPAIYLHSLLYIFHWLMNGDWEGRKVVPHGTKEM